MTKPLTNFGAKAIDATAKKLKNAKDATAKKLKNAKDAGSYALGKVGNLVGGILFIPFFALEIVARVTILPFILTVVSLQSVAGYFSDKFDETSYQNLDKLANSKITECGKIAEFLQANWRQEEDNQTHQNVLQVLSNIYSALDYIEQAEESYRDRNQYSLNKFEKYLNILVSRVRDPLFKQSKLYSSMNESKKLLYLVYRTLQNCDPKSLKDVKSEILEGKRTGPTSEIDTKIDGIKAEMAKLAKEKKDAADTKELDTKIEELTEQIKKLEDSKSLFQEIDNESKEDPAELDGDEKLIKKMVKEAPTIKFEDKDLDVNKIFENPKTFVVKRYSSESKKDFKGSVDLMSDVSILAPNNPPALASIYVYRTDVDPNQAEKDVLAKEKKAEDKVKSDARTAEKIKKDERYSREREAKRVRNSEIKKTRLTQNGLTTREKIASKTSLSLKDKEIKREVERVRASHRAAAETMELEYKLKNRKFSAEISEAKRKEGTEKQVARIIADKKKSETEHKAELDKLNDKFNQVLDKIKPGEQVEKIVSGTSTITSVSGTSVSGTSNTNKSQNKTNVTKKNKNKNKNKNTTSNVTKKQNGPRTVCITKAMRKKCFIVETVGGELSITPKPE
jgi:hypothetical protein